MNESICAYNTNIAFYLGVFQGVVFIFFREGRGYNE
jgi:hypothetical protein